MAASAGLSCRVAERGERVLYGCFPGCMWHLSGNSQRTGNPTLVKSAQRERISGNQKFKECRNFGRQLHEEESRRQRCDVCGCLSSHVLSCSYSNQSYVSHLTQAVALIIKRTKLSCLSHRCLTPDGKHNK